MISSICDLDYILRQYCREAIWWRRLVKEKDFMAQCDMQ